MVVSCSLLCTLLSARVANSGLSITAVRNVYNFFLSKMVVNNESTKMPKKWDFKKQWFKTIIKKSS